MYISKYINKYDMLLKRDTKERESHNNRRHLNMEQMLGMIYAD